MVDSKRKGKRWERDAVKELNKAFGEVWKRIPGSGALGTQLSISQLKGDLVGKYKFIKSPFRGEAKTGYGGATQLAIKREWFDKIAEEAKSGMRNHIPIVICKFSGSRSDTRYFISMTFQAWDELMQEVKDIYEENIRLREELDGRDL